MTPQELANTCAERASWYTLRGFDPKEATVLVVTPKGWKPPPRWPRGQIVRWNEDGSRVRYFPALTTLAWLVGHGLAKVEMRVVGGLVKAGAPILEEIKRLDRAAAAASDMATLAPTPNDEADITRGSGPNNPK